MSRLVPERFRAMPVADRLEVLREQGIYMGSRIHGGHQVHLYGISGFYCEVWMRLGLRYVEWVEVLRNDQVLSEYVDLDLKELLGGDAAR
jgi:hypothetical protein